MSPKAVLPLLAAIPGFLMVWLDAIVDVASEFCDTSIEMDTGTCVYTDGGFAAVLLGAHILCLAVLLLAVLILRKDVKPMFRHAALAILSTTMATGLFLLLLPLGAVWILFLIAVTGLALYVVLSLRLS